MVTSQVPQMAGQQDPLPEPRELWLGMDADALGRLLRYLAWRHEHVGAEPFCTVRADGSEVWRHPEQLRRLAEERLACFLRAPVLP